MNNKEVIRKMNHITEAVAGSQGEAYINVNGQNLSLASLKKFEAKFKLKMAELNILGETGAKSRPAGWEGTWEATLYYNQSTLRKLALQYAETGVLPTFDLKIVNNDPMSTSTIGRKSYTFLDCYFEELILAMLDVDSEVLEEEVSGRFSGVKDHEDHKEAPRA
ncbi:phage tail tube protein [Peptostreptococcus faecalis]|uniref:phage tail tube protein n=1 Tax=Peptostreptococcus faecalis TaxID=2045015 RepID=UPI000C7DEB82|nr:phage tail tube protein [Peptostreptococcus faecalis]